LALDETCERKLKQLKMNNIEIINLYELEKTFLILLNAKKNRSKIEYVFTLTPFLFLFVMKEINNANHLIIYLDADLFFFNDPTEIYEELDNSSVGVIPHRFTKSLNKKLLKFGKYNVGMVLIKNDTEGKRVVSWWASKCLEWCHDYVEDNKFADQKYLEGFFLQSDQVSEISHLGANLAPWNIGNYNLKLVNNNIYVNEDKLIFFHFHSFKLINNKFVIPNFLYKTPVTNFEKFNIYHVYLEYLKKEIIDSRLDDFIFFESRQSQFKIINNIFIFLQYKVQIFKKNYLKYN